MSLFDSIKDVGGRILAKDPVVTDNFVFSLHHLWTVTLLITFSVLLSLSQVYNPTIFFSADLFLIISGLLYFSSMPVTRSTASTTAR